MVELQGQLFFGNGTNICSRIQKILSEEQEEVWYLLLDFTLVLGIDCSAAESLAKINSICKRYRTKVCYSKGSKKGFPGVAAALADQLDKLAAEAAEESVKLSTAVLNVEDQYFHSLHVTDNLDNALAWCEEDIIYKFRTKYSGSTSGKSPRSPSALKDALDLESDNTPLYIKQLKKHCPYEKTDTIRKILSYFHPEFVPAGTLLWSQGDFSDRALLLSSGKLLSYIPGEVSDDYQTCSSCLNIRMKLCYK